MPSALETESEKPHLPQAARQARRRRMSMIAGAFLAVTLLVIVFLSLVSTISGSQTSVLIGVLGADRLMNLAVFVGLAALAVGLCAIPVSRLWLLLVVPARIVAVVAVGAAGLVWMLMSTATVVPLLSDGCETGYVVEERSFLFAASGTVYHSDGIFVTAVERTGADDGYHPFDDGAYAVEQTGDSLRVWYNFSYDAAATPVAAAGAPAFTLPKLADRPRACGLSTGAREPEAAWTPPPAYSPLDLRRGVEDMSVASLEAAAGLIRDSAGVPIDPHALEPEQEGCNEEGSQFVAMLEFETDDNTASLARILEVWDAAGYSPDRAMQEDIRYSETLEVAKMSIRDTTTIDGLLHMQITSQCSIGR